jgi:hypothetical protein
MHLKALSRLCPKMTTLSPQCQGLGFAGGVPLGGDSAQIPPEDPPQRIPHIADMLSKDPNFIKSEFHIRRFITTAVDTEKECAITEAFEGNLESTSQQININILLFFFLHYITTLWSALTSLFN